MFPPSRTICTPRSYLSTVCQQSSFLPQGYDPTWPPLMNSTPAFFATALGNLRALRVVARRPVRIGMVHSGAIALHTSPSYSTVVIRGASLINFRFFRCPFRQPVLFQRPLRQLLWDAVPRRGFATFQTCREMRKPIVRSSLPNRGARVGMLPARSTILRDRRLTKRARFRAGRSAL